MSLRTLANLTPCAVSWLSTLENGGGQPSQDMARRLDAALDAHGALLALLHDQEEGEMQRRVVLRALSAAGLAASGWPTLGGDIPRRVGPEHVAEVVETTALYRGWVPRQGGEAVRVPAARLLERAADLHAAATDPAVRHDLLVALADLAGLGGYIARDVGAHTSAAEHGRLALSAAAAAGATALGAHTLARMAGHHIELRQPSQTLGLLEVAHRQAGHLLTAGERSNQAAIRAWAHAQAGDVEQAHRWVGIAEELHTRDDTAAGYRAQHVTEAELWSLTGAAYVELARVDPGRAATAIGRLEKAISLRGLVPSRNRALDRLSLSEALLLSGEVDEGARTALEAVQDGSGITSGRLRTRMAEVVATFRPHARVSAATAELVSAAAR